ncbi:DUF1367 family protein [Rodentibacter pneumotropicus]|nr:DUF1367 family protein [Rodentibacter pneumotropicus]THA07276.1 DUF1367 family protein [Rodentibacter pneumotropicus]THA10423.1 DUF1367 family protein [Rodentibacter pneumotropicus]THA16164.1 DUF1367 family protein [Rodentibacter pneumotropicus]
MIKNAGGVLCPADEMYLDKFKHFENGGLYEIEIKKVNNPALHRKLFSFFKFCFDHYNAENSAMQFADEAKQFNHFRKRLTILAGFFEEYVDFDTGEIKQEAQSLRFDEMDNIERAECLSAIINAALKHVFSDTTDENVINQLYAFF